MRQAIYLRIDHILQLEKCSCVKNLPCHNVNDFQADDDTYVIVENLRYLLQSHDTNEPVYLGLKFQKYVTNGYHSGGAGYVLRKEALKRFVTQVSA